MNSDLETTGETVIWRREPMVVPASSLSSAGSSMGWDWEIWEGGRRGRRVQNKS